MFRKVIGQKSDEDTINPLAPEPQVAAPVNYGHPAAPSYSAASLEPSPAPAPRVNLGPSRNVLSADVEIKGSVKFTSDLIVDGRIEGEIISDGNLTVGENARLRTEIKTSAVIVYGKVHGNITAVDRVELKSTAEVVGDIKSKTLVMEAGAIFVGKSTIGTPSGSAPAAPAPYISAPTPEPAAEPEASEEEPNLI
jgi:cytoskeletal protein CcmA (bactofilin family)